MSGELEEDPNFDEITIKIEEDGFPKGKKRLKETQKAMRKRSHSNDEKLYDYQKKSIHDFKTSKEGLLIDSAMERDNASPKVEYDSKRKLNNLPSKSSKMISSSGSHSSYHCESISGFESTIGDTTSSFTYIQNLKDCSIEKHSSRTLRDREQAHELTMLRETNAFKDQLLRCFSDKVRALKAENLAFRHQTEKDKAQIEMYQNEAEEYHAQNRMLNSKLLESVKFLAKTTEIDEKSSDKGILHKTLQENETLNQKLVQTNIENEMLRKFLNLQVELNSLKSFAQEIRKFEEESQNVKGLSPSRNQEVVDKGTTKSILKRSIRDKYKRGRRKRTESFHYSEFGDTSPDDEEGKDTTLNKLRRKSVRVNEFSSGYSMQAMENLQQKQAEIENSEEMSSSSSSSSSESQKSDKEEEKKIEEDDQKKQEDENQPPKGILDRRAKMRLQKRARIKSTGQSIGFTGLSPAPAQKRTRGKQLSDEDSFGFGLKKGGGYKMSMEATDNKEETKEEEKDSPKPMRTRQSNIEDDDDYSCSFNKNPSFKVGGKAKRNRRVNSMAHQDADSTSQELSDSKFKMPAKIKYSIHSIIEEEKSRSSSSTSSVKSSDDLTFYFNTNPHLNKRKRSSFMTKTSSASQAQESDSSEAKSLSNKRLLVYKTKKYTDSHLSFLSDTPEKPQTTKKKSRRNSMAIILNNLE